MSSPENNSPELLLLSESPYETPDPNKALADPDGLAAVGGDLSSERLIHLYSKGFFPWFSEPDPILWWHPSERCTLNPALFHQSRSLSKAIKKAPWCYSFNQAFDQVIEHCADLRKHQEGTWISPEIQQAYRHLHTQGYAHSIEIWLNDELVGGFYGVAIGKMFFGESMFSLKANASKVALSTFCRLAQSLDIALIDCQVESEHLMSLGAELTPRTKFIRLLEELTYPLEKNRKLETLAQAGKQKLP
ncbi:leucyl/phenylalanyl-tRNA--protein transferase [Marinomonas epiphytica]